jgi:hypothetical protein
MAQIFISFIHEEEAVADALQRFLKEQLGHDADMFLSSDKWQIFAGELWLERIRDELKNASVVILMMSKRSVERPWVNFEAGAAWLTGKVIIPACFGGLSKGDLPKPYSSIQAVDLKENPYYLLSSICHHLGRIAPLPIVMSFPSTINAETGDATRSYSRLLDAIIRYESP